MLDTLANYSLSLGFKEPCCMEGKDTISGA